MKSTVISISDVKAEHRPLERLNVRADVQSLLRRRIEAMDVSDARLVCCEDSHPLVKAAHDAFYLHYPLTLGPDDIWFCIAQGFARHVNLNSEALRHHFVSHSGKCTLTVERTDFVLGQFNPWPEAFTEFSIQIAKHVGQQLHDRIVADFSTTTAFHRAATEVALMDSFQTYFEYLLSIGCGIPAVHLRGAPDDWRNIRCRAAELAQYGLEKWIGALLPILDQLEASSRGHSDQEFWQSFFRHKSSSFGSTVTGWINVLFPYLKAGENQFEVNPYVETWSTDLHTAIARAEGHLPSDHRARHGPYLERFPTGVSSAPVTVLDMRTQRKHAMRFVAGMFGVSQDDRTKSLSPTFGWAVAYDEPIPPPDRRRRR